MKYMGGKARFAKEFLPIILKDRKPGQWYVEPFAGGMNVIDKVENPRIANDINPYLIAMWEKLLSGWIPPKVGRELYEKVRDNKDKYPLWAVGWVGFNCSYSGKFFGGYAGETKTKIGTIRDYQQEAINNVLKQVPLLRGTIFLNTQYWSINLPNNSIIYCDPPYQNTTKYATDFDHETFWAWVRFNSNHHQIFVSEYNAPDDFECVWETQAKSSLSANGKIGGNKISTERLYICRKCDIVSL